MAKLKDGDYYEQYNITERQEYFRWWDTLELFPRYRTVVVGQAYRINDGGESYSSQLLFTAEIELIFKMFAPATNTFASNSQGTNLWATTLPGGVSD